MRRRAGRKDQASKRQCRQQQLNRSARWGGELGSRIIIISIIFITIGKSGFKDAVAVNSARLPAPLGVLYHLCSIKEQIGFIAEDNFKDLVRRDSVVGIASRYELCGPGIEKPVQARFSAPVQTDHGVHPASCTMGTGSISRVV